MGRFFAETFERRTGHPLAIVSGDTRTAALVALSARSRPSVYFASEPLNSPWVTAADIRKRGAIVVWPAANTDPAPPPEIKTQFPDLVPEVPQTFERPVRGRLPPLLIGWGMIRPANASASALSGATVTGSPCLGAGGSNVALSGQCFFQRQKIPPGKPFLQRASQQERRMVRRDGADFPAAGVEFEPAAARSCDAFPGSKQRLGCRLAEADKDIRVRKLDLAADEGQADRGLLRRRRPIAGRPPRHDVGDIGARYDQARWPSSSGRALSRPADERNPGDVLIPARRLAHEHDTRFGVAGGKYQLGSGGAQHAALENFEQRA